VFINGDQKVPDHSALQTSASLLVRLQDAADQAAWGEFVGRYGPLILGWCRHWRLQESDAQDVTQVVLVKLVEKMRTFSYDPSRSFRAYLKTLARYAWCDFVEMCKRPGGGSGDTQELMALHAVEAGDDLVQRLDKEFDQEQLAHARIQVQQRVEAHTWEAFHLTAVEGLSGAEVAERLGLKVATVFKAKSKVQKMLQAEIARLDGL
jgi:RNA polymerase sigma factor (sigma-70 family)